jgi:hypothetical protein
MLQAEKEGKKEKKKPEKKKAKNEKKSNPDAAKEKQLPPGTVCVLCLVVQPTAPRSTTRHPLSVSV